MSNEPKREKSGLSYSLRVEASDFIHAKQLDKALILLNRAEQFSREQNDDSELQAVLGDKAGVFRWRGEFSEAMKILKEQESIVRRTKNMDGLQLCLGNQAVLLREIAFQDKNASKLMEAIKLAQEQYNISLDEKIPSGIQFASGTMGLIFRDLGKLDKAELMFEEQVKMLREMDHKVELGRCLLNLAILNLELRRPAKSTTLLDEAESIATSLEDAMLKERINAARKYVSVLGKTV